MKVRFFIHAEELDRFRKSGEKTNSVQNCALMHDGPGKDLVEVEVDADKLDISSGTISDELGGNERPVQFVRLKGS